MKGITLVYDEAWADEARERIISLFAQHLKIIIAFKSDLKVEIGHDDFIVTYLSDEQLKDFLPIAIEKNWKIGFLPHPGMLHARQGFGVSPSLDDAIGNILNTESAQKIDMLMANGRPVFNTVVIGQSLSVMSGSPAPTETKRKLGRAKSFFELFKRVSLQKYTIEYKEKGGGEKEVINTAALGMVVVQHGKSTLLSRRIIEDSFVNDGMMHSLILAPESVAGLLEFGILSLFRSKRNPKLPPFAAHIKTGKIKVLSDQPMDLSIDGALMSAKEVELEVVPKIIQIVPGIYLDTEAKGSNKEVFKTQSLPRGEKRDELVKGPLPFINHATTDEFKDLFTTLRENSKPSSSYLVLMFLSTFIATLGLFSNSSPVIIGAMILAPLMAPIISLSMGVLRQDQQLVRYSLKSIGLGLLLGYLCAVLITLVTPLHILNVEIMARTRPNLLDLGVAVGSGMAGAYAHSKKEVTQTLAGVAIAVALVPPLAVSGIGLGWLNWSVFSGALLLLTTNLSGMVLAAAITFLFLGFSPFRLARKGLLVSLILVVLVSAPLAFGFSRMVQETNIVQHLSGQRIDNMIIRNVEVRQFNPLRLSLRIVTERPMTEEDLTEVKREIEALLGEEVELEITMGIKM
jgi:uncharacterized hydrophobic protein (TIGR00271 family)